MNLLLDTHVALWAITDDKKLKEARDLILDSLSVVWVSVVSIWEISIKHSLSKHNMPISGKEALTNFELCGYNILDINAKHAVLVEELENHHKDPFDRLLIAQTMLEPMKFVTKDLALAKYTDLVIVI